MLFDITRTLDLQRLLYMLGDQIERIGLFDGYLIALFDAQRGGLVCARTHFPASHAGMQGVLQDYCFSLNDAVPLVEAYRGGVSVIRHVDDLDPEDALGRQSFTFWQASASAALPIPYADGLIGALTGFKQQGRIAERDVRALEEQLAVFNEPLRHALMLDELRQGQVAVEAALREHERFVRFVLEINSLGDVERVFDVTLQQLLAAYRFDVGSLSLLEPGVGLVPQRVSVRDAGHAERRERLLSVLPDVAPLDVTFSASVFAFMQNIHLFIPDVDAVRHLAMAPADRAVIDALPEIRSILHVPLREQGQPVGMLGLMSFGEPRPLSEDELSMIKLLASFVGKVIANARLYQVVDDQRSRIEMLNHELQGRVQELDELVRRDPLTGLQNFGAFRGELARRVDEVNRHPERVDLSVVIVDIDHFKRLNDRWGHVVGNLVLQELAQRIAGTARGMDVPCRFGGEEFAVILPHSGLAEARVFAERLRGVVGEAPFQVGSERLALTVSAGCAQYRAGEDVEAFLTRADQALYRAKANGRNRVEIAPDDLAL